MFRPPTPRLDGTLLPGGSPSRPSPPGGAPLRSVPPLRSAPALTWPPAWAVTGCVSRAGLAAPIRWPGLGALTFTRQRVDQPNTDLRLVADTLLEVGDGEREDAQIAGNGVIG